MHRTLSFRLAALACAGLLSLGAAQAARPAAEIASRQATDTAETLVQPGQLKIAKALGPIARAARAKVVPLSIGLPFGLSAVLPFNVPLPSKIVMQVLPPVDPTAIAFESGDEPDIDAVDAHVRKVMQDALDELAEERRFPVLG